MRIRIFFFFALTTLWDGSALGRLPVDRLLHITPAEVGLGFEPISFDGETAGLGSLHFSLMADSGWYAGLSAFTATSGSRGGLIALGPRLGYRLPLSETFAWRAELFAGGGGGANAPVGSGLMLRPATYLELWLESFSVLAGCGLISFPDGRIQSPHWIVQVSLPTSMAFVSEAEAPDAKGESLEWDRLRWQIGPSFKLYLSQGKIDLDGTAMQSKVGLVGFEFSSYVSESFFINLQLHSLFLWGASGYMTVGPGVGYLWPIIPGLAFKPQLNFGGAGGGRVDTGGGFFLEPTAALELMLSRSNSVTLGLGYFYTFSGFKAPSVTISFAHDLNVPHFQVASPRKKKMARAPLSSVSRIRFGISTQRYWLKGQPVVGSAGTTENNVDLLGINFEYLVLPYLALNGSTYWAYAGHAGGYASGLLGLVFELPLSSGVNGTLRIGAGAGGGGYLPASSGLLFQGALGTDIALSSDLRLVIEGGALRFAAGTFAPTCELGLKYVFGFGEL